MEKRRAKTIHHIVEIVVVIIVLALVVAFGWGMFRSPDDEADTQVVQSVESDSTYVIGLTDRPTSLDIRTDTNDAVEQALLENVYETLIQRDNNNDLVPGIAKSWDKSADGLTYTLHLNTGMHFANGDPMDASDVVWSLQQIITNKYVEYEDLGSIASVSNSDAQTVQVTLNSTNPRFLRALSSRAGIVYNKNEAAIDYAKSTAGSGPFAVASFNEDELKLVRNENYWGTNALASQITLKYFSSESALVDALKDSSINMGYPTRAASIEDLQNNPTYDVTMGTSLEKVLVGFNCSSDSPLSDEQVRKAVRYAINASEIADSQPDALAQLSGPISPMFPGYEDLDNLFPYDASKAQQMLSFFAPGYTGTITLLAPIRYQDLAETIQNELENVGLNINLEILDVAELDKRVQSGDYTMALLTLNDPLYFTDYLDSNGIFHYENGDAQRAYEYAMQATSDADYNTRMAAFAKIVSEDAASAWLYTRKDFIISKARWDGYPTNLTSHYLPLKNLTR